jgi:hypothetical protein
MQKPTEAAKFAAAVGCCLLILDSFAREAGTFDRGRFDPVSPGA